MKETTSVPSEVDSGSDILVSWSVSGEGLSAVHTAIHYGSTSNPGNFGTDVGPPGGYSQLTTEFASGDFPLPDDFSTSISTDSSGVMYLRAHTIVDDKHYWTDEVAVTINEGEMMMEDDMIDMGGPTIAFTSIPQSGTIARSMTFTWRVEGDGSATHTAIHYDFTSHSGDLGTEDGPSAAGYPELTTEFASGNFPLPDDFSTQITPMRSGALYLRAHAIIDGKNYWTEETTISIMSSGSGNY
jgi:hypothetical protein